jgi:translocation and assembly module TamB
MRRTSTGPDAPPIAPGRARRAIAAVAKATGLGLVFGLAAAGGVLLHLELGAPRRFATTRVNGILAHTFEGSVHLQKVGVLHLGRLDGVDAEVLDPEGKRVLELRGVRARFGTLALVRSLFSGDRLVVRIPELTINAAELVIEDDPAGEIGLIRAFHSRQPSAPGGRGTEIVIGQLTIHHTWVHGHLAAAPILDADLEELAGAFTSTPDTTDIDIKHLFVRARGLGGMSPEGDVEASAALPSGADGDRRAHARYEGRIGAIPVRADGSLTGDEVVAVLDVPETEASAFTALAPDQLQLGAPVSAHAEVHGTLPTLRPELRARIGASELTAAGTVTLPGEARPDLVAAAKLAVKDLDLSLLKSDAPRSKLTATLDADVISRPGGSLSGTFALENQIGEVSGQVVPELHARGTFTEQSVRGATTIDERGAPTLAEFSLQPRRGGASPDQLALKLDTTVPDLNGIARVGPIARGRAHLVGEASLDLTSKQVSANASVELAAIDAGGVQLARGVVTGSAKGALASPHVVARLLGAGLRAGGYAFPSVRAGVSGAPADLDVTAQLVGDEHAPTVTARTRLANHGDLALRGAVIDLKRGEVTSTATIASVHIAGGTVDIRGLRLAGLGEPLDATARISASGATVRARAADIDLARVATLLGRGEGAQGHLSLDVDATATRAGVDGRVEAQLRDLSARDVKGGTVHVLATAQGTHVHAAVSAALGEVGKIELSAPDVVLAGPATKVSAWKNATGAVTLDGAVDLARLLAQLPETARPVESASGTLALRGSASRASVSASPTLDLTAATTGLTVVAGREKHPNADGSVTLGPERFHTAGLDGDLAVKLDGDSGRAEISARLHDRAGALATVDARARLPLAELVKSPDRLVALLRETAFEADVAVPRRSLDALPPALGQLPVKGDVELALAFRGTARAPKLTLSARGTHLIPRVAAACVTGTEVETKLTYDGEQADVHVTASRDRSEILATAARVKVSAAEAMAGGALGWEAAGDVTLTGFPLDVVGALAGQPVAGSVSGKVALRDLHRAASLDADLDLRALSLDKVTFPSGKVRVGIKDGTISATARLDQRDGYAETSVTGAMAWGAALAPQLDAGKPVEVALHARNFRADAAMPFVQGVFSELDGRIDTDAKVHIAPGGKDGKMDGAIMIRDGVFELPQIGERFHAVRAHLIMKPWGTIRLEELSAEAPTGKVTASAEAVMRGLAFQSAAGRIHIAKGDSIPITLEGVPMGRAYGEVTLGAKASPDGKRLDVDVDVPMLHVDLPQSTGHAVQPLELDRTVRVGRHAGRDFVTIPLAPPETPRAPGDMVIRAAFKLGDDVAVKRDTTVQIVASGQVNVEVTDRARVTGVINLERGKLELQGKVFTIDRATVSFVGPDPANPLITATAYWDAPDATRVFADFSGRVSSGKLQLRAEPSLTQDEILALILFGSMDGSLGAQPPAGQAESTGVKAAGLAGSVVTEGLNKAISGITSVDISTRVDTSKADNPRPELAVQISKKVSARLGYKLGVPAPGENPDRTELTLDWRFIRNWSLVAVVGDQGSTALDVVWRFRY